LLKTRLIATLLIRDGLIVQSFGFNKYLPIGKPRFPIQFVARWDVDEIVLLDISASSENRGPHENILEMLSHYCYVPLSVGGGISSVKNVRQVIRAGADKAIINTHALARADLITEIADVFGSQCTVVSIDCRRENNGQHQVFSNSGTKATGLHPIEWAKLCVDMGAGEIFLNSIDNDGSRLGYDLELIKSVVEAVNVPVIACGGVGNFSHFAPGILETGASAVAAGNIFHHIEHSTIFAKAHMIKSGIDVRLDSQAKYDSREFDEDGRLVMHTGDYLSELELKRKKLD